MAISSALNNAISGLTAASRQTEVISSNLANANTPGYANRELELSSRVIGGYSAGVQVVGVVRNSNPTLIADRRGAEADMGNAQTRADFYARAEEIIGTPEDAGSLSTMLGDFEASLATAAALPENEARLSEVLASAQNLTKTLNGASDDIQTERLRADNAIETQVETLNTRLDQVADINASIVRGRGAGFDVSSLMDQRQLLVDEINQIVPIRQLQRDNDQIALYTATGVSLLDGRPAVVEFSATNTIVPEMTLASGGLSGLTVNGRAISVGPPQSDIAGGTLAAEFAVRDDLAPEVQAQLDAFTRDLVERFEPLGDAVTGLGLLTDNGAAFDPLNEVGLSARLSVNAVVDPAQGGEVYRIRDGLDATTAGPVSDGSLLFAMQEAMTSARAPASATLSGAARTSSGLAGEVLSFVGRARETSEQNLTTFSAQFQSLKASELQDGVDSDFELQKLLLVETAYAANARVIQTIDEMLEQILRL